MPVFFFGFFSLYRMVDGSPPPPQVDPSRPSGRPAHGKLSPRRMYGVRALPSRVPLAVAIETPYHNFWGFRLTEMELVTNQPWNPRDLLAYGTGVRSTHICECVTTPSDLIEKGHRAMRATTCAVCIALHCIARPLLWSCAVAMLCMRHCSHKCPIRVIMDEGVFTYCSLQQQATTPHHISYRTDC